jgi:predicted DNA-binding transcriptional regulator AlpA
MEKRLMDIKELSEYISMPVPTIYTYVSTGKIPADCIKRIGRALKFEVGAVDRWITGPFAVQASAPKYTQSAH